MSIPSPHLEPNLAALAAAGQPPGRLDASSARVRIEAGAGADLDIRISASGDRWVRLHSGRNPLVEAERWIAGAMAEHPGAPVVVIGAGAGYVLEALEAKNPDVRVVVIEPDPAIVAALLARRDWRPWIAARRLAVLTGPAYAGASAARELCESDVAPVLLTNPVMAREWAADVGAATEVARRLIFDAAGNREARRRTAGIYLLNTLRNLPWLAHSGDVAALAGLGRGLPAVVAAAGPSLPGNVVAAGAALADTILISADTALRPLLRLGATPRFVVGLDPSEANARHFFSLVGTENVWLVGEASLSPGVFGEFRDRAFAFQVSGHQPWPWLQRAGFARGRLRAWGSVLTAAYNLAVLLECDPIVFVGADMAFTGGQPYARGTTFEEDWAASVVGGLDLPGRLAWDIERRSDVVTEPDVHGGEVTTTGTLRSFRDWFVTAVKEDTKRRVLNATEGGIFRGDGVTQIPASRLREHANPAARQVLDRVRVAHRHDEGAWQRLRGLAGAVVERGGDAADAPLAAWDSFVLGTVDRAAMLGTLREAAAGLGGEPPAPQPRPPVVEAAERLEREQRSPLFNGLFHPERVATIAAWLARVPPPAWVGPTVPLAPVEAVRWLDLAAAGLSVLQREADPLATDGLPPSVPAMSPETTPASAIADWRPGPRRLVWAIEMLVTRVLRSVDALPPGHAWVLEPPLALDPDPAAAGVPVVSGRQPGEIREAFARAQLLREWMLALAQVGGDDRSALRAAALCGAVARAIAGADDPSADALVTVTVGTAAASEPVVARTALHSASLTRAFTGWTTAWPPGVPEPQRRWRVSSGSTVADVEVAPTQSDSPARRREMFLAAGGTFVEPRLVSPEGALYTHVVTLDAKSALATGVGASSSVCVDEQGRVTAEPAWPHPIDGEMALADGGRLAWTGTLVRSGEGEAVMQWRPARGGAVQVERMPFVSVHPVTGPDGALYWPALTGGLWRWSPGGPSEQVRSGPPLVNAIREGETLRVEPIDLAAGRVRLPPGSLGAVWARAEAGGVTADAHPHADCVILRKTSGPGLALVAYYPVGVAWAGRSLLVLSATGHLLRFEGLHSAL